MKKGESIDARAERSRHVHVIFSDSPTCFPGRLGRVRLGSSICLSTQVGRGGSSLEEAGEKGLEERVEDDLSAAGRLSENSVREAN